MKYDQNIFSKKLIYVGTLTKVPDRDWKWIREFSNLGWEIIPYSSLANVVGNKYVVKFKNRFCSGSEYDEMRLNLYELCKKENPIWIHFPRPVEFDKLTLTKIKKIVPLVTHYFNDDPFSKKNPIGLYWRFRKALNLFDIHFVYRKINIPEFKNAGAKNIYHVPPMYDNLDILTKKENSKNFIADAAFIGHWENDNRIKFLSKVMNSGLSLIVKGGLWERGTKGTPLDKLQPIKPVFGKEYNYIYSNVVAGICFFSKINRDTFTRRALEIVAIGGVLVCERTEEALSYFEDKKEALFFDTPDELVSNIKLLKENYTLRNNLKEAAFHKLINGKFSINDRAIFINEIIQNKLNNLIKINN